MCNTKLPSVVNCLVPRKIKKLHSSSIRFGTAYIRSALSSSIKIQCMRFAKAKNQKQYSVHLCEEVHKVNVTSAAKSPRIFRMRPNEQIYLSDVPWYMNEHSKFVNSLNGRSSRCKFNGYIQLDEGDFIPGVPCHTSRPHFN
ncbi:unnamed protein product [Dicrocoelium dendriticum]|nr:unnamed protein product [Dicrocoelium dendriticum]